MFVLLWVAGTKLLPGFDLDWSCVPLVRIWGERSFSFSTRGSRMSFVWELSLTNKLNDCYESCSLIFYDLFTPREGSHLKTFMVWTTRKWRSMWTTKHPVSVTSFPSKQNECFHKMYSSSASTSLSLDC